MKRNTWILLASAAVGLTVIGVVVAGSMSGVPVRVVEVRWDTIHESVDERGITRLPRTYLITMPFDGRITAIGFQEGDAVYPAGAKDPQGRDARPVARVVPGDVQWTVDEAAAIVGRLEKAIEKNNDKTVEDILLAQAKKFVESMGSTVESAQEQVKASDKKHEFFKKILGRFLETTNLVSEQEIDRARLDEFESYIDLEQDKLVLRAMLSLQAATDLLPDMVERYTDRKGLTEAVLLKEKAEATARLDQVVENQRRGTMYSPVEGVVLKRYVSNERQLSAGTSLLEIGDLDELEVEADVLSLDVVDAHEGARAEIHGPAIGPEPVVGKVSRVYPAGFTKVSSLGVEQQRVKVIVQLDKDDLARLRQQRNMGVGYRVRVRIFTQEKERALVVPRSALFRDSQGEWQVYILADGRLAVRAVKIGLLNDELAEVAAGLEEGDRVVRAPEKRLVAGQRASARE